MYRIPQYKTLLSGPVFFPVISIEKNPGQPTVFQSRFCLVYYLINFDSENNYSNILEISCFEQKKGVHMGSYTAVLSCV